MEAMVTGSVGEQERQCAPAVYDIREVAGLLGRPYSTVWQWHREGRIPVESFKLGSSWLFRKSEIDAWLGIGQSPNGE